MKLRSKKAIGKNAKNVVWKEDLEEIRYFLPIGNYRQTRSLTQQLISEGAIIDTVEQGRNS